MKARDEIRSCLDRMLFAGIQGMRDGDPDKVHTNEMLAAKEEAHRLLLGMCEKPLAECAGCEGC